MTDLSRQTTMISREHLASLQVQVIGCGGIGSWIALFLHKAGVPDLRMWDEDHVEESNLHRTPYLTSQVGLSKSAALFELMEPQNNRSEGYLRLAFGHWENDTFAGTAGSIIVGAVDGMELRQKIYKAATKEGCTYIDVGAEAMGGQVCGTPAGWEIEKTDDAYFTPIFIAPVVMAAAAVVWRILRQHEGYFSFAEEVRDSAAFPFPLSQRRFLTFRHLPE